MKACVKSLLLVFPLLICFQGAAQSLSSSDDYVAQAWDTDSGLPQSTVISIVQTPDGYLWAGTLLGGLARFDGSSFANFHPGNTPELKSMEIHKLLVDAGGTLWIGGVDGSLSSYRDGKFHFEFENGQIPASRVDSIVSWQTNQVVLSSLGLWLFRGTNVNGTNSWATFETPAGFLGPPCEDRAGTIWYRTSDGHLAQIQGEKVVRMDNPPGLTNQQVNVLFKDDTDRIWVGTDKAIAVWDGNTFVNMTPTNGEPELAVRDVAVCHDGTFWVRTDDKLRRCANRRWLTEAEGWDGKFQPSTRPLAIYGDTQGGVWVIEYGDGLWHVDRGGHVSRVGIQQGLPNTLFECWCEDSEGNFWVGLTDGGLACVRPRIFHTVWPPEDVQTRSVRSVCEDAQGAMWFGSARQEVVRWQDGRFTTFTPPAQPSAGFEATVLPAGSNQMWVGTACNGLWLLDNGVFSRPFASTDIGTVVRCLYLDHTGALWIGNEFGLYRWQKGVLKTFTQTDGFSPAYVLSIAEDSAGDMWFGTAAGELRRYHAGKFESYRPSDLSPNLVSETNQDQTTPSYSGTLFGRERFWALHFDTDGVLWIGSLGGGLLRFEDGHFTRYTTQNGLPNEDVSQILEDDRGELWLGTRAGIARVAKSDLNNFATDSNSPINFITYGKYDGLPSLECSGNIQPACWKSRDGRLWFSTIKGPVWVNPLALHFNPRPPPVQLEEVLVDGKRMTDDPVSPTQPGARVPDRMRIAAGGHYFEFKFAAMSFTSPDKVRFRWRLIGLEPNWVDGGTHHTASYSFLPPGNYQFEVQACNNDGVWNDAGATTRLIVLPYFWQTWWFEIATGLFLTAVLLAIYSFRIARFRTLEKLRLRIARDLHDEVGANLGSISLLSQIMEQTPSRSDATQVRNLATQTIDTLRDIVWLIDPTHDRLSDLVARLHGTARVMLPALEVKFDQVGDFDSTSLPLAFRRNVPPLFKETLHNLLTHSHATSVGISVRRNDGAFQFCVHDNGVGFDRDQKYAGNGLKNMKRRAAEIGGQITIESRPGFGTAVTLVAPITRTRDWCYLKKLLRSG